MVTANDRGNLSIIATNLCGAVMFCACAGLLLFVFVYSGDDAGDELAALRGDLTDARATYSTLLRKRDEQDALLADRLDALQEKGRLPQRAPIESFFQAISVLAEQNDIQVLRQAPHSERVYPGLREHRYTYEVLGRMGDVALFLYEIERTDYWADVGFLKVVPAAPAARTANLDRRATLTISLFAAEQARETAESG